MDINKPAGKLQVVQCMKCLSSLVGEAEAGVNAMYVITSLTQNHKLTIFYLYAHLDIALRRFSLQYVNIS